MLNLFVSPVNDAPSIVGLNFEAQSKRMNQLLSIQICYLLKM